MSNVIGRDLAQAPTNGLLGALAYWSRAQLEAHINRHLIVEEQQANGVGGGSISSANTWFTRTLNVEVVNTIPGASLASNLITLPKGTYRVTGSAPAFAPSYHKCRIYNVTAGAAVTTALGTSEYAPSNQGRSWIDGVIVLTETSTLRLEHCVSNPYTWGLPAGPDMPEVYSRLAIQKVS